MDRCRHDKGFVRPPPPLYDVRSIEGKPPIKHKGHVCKLCQAEVSQAVADAADERVSLLARLEAMKADAEKAETRLEDIDKLLDEAPVSTSAAAALPAGESVEAQAKRLSAPVDHDDAPLPTLDELAKMTPEQRRDIGAHMKPEQRQRLAELLK
jgi:hypothetical protein